MYYVSAGGGGRGPVVLACGWEMAHEFGADTHGNTQAHANTLNGGRLGECSAGGGG